jgi:hypothetical protein
LYIEVIMKKLAFLTMTAALPVSAFAHTGDHASVSASAALAHAFTSPAHIAGALAVMASIAAVVAVTSKAKQALAARRAK